MWPILLLLHGASLAPQPAVPTKAAASHSPTVHDVLVAEHLRESGIEILKAAMASGDSVLQRHAARAIGRLGDTSLSNLLSEALRLGSLTVKRESATALGLVGEPDLLLANGPVDELKDEELRARSYESIGRLARTERDVEALLKAGIVDASLVARAGAARGLESFVRRNARRQRPSSEFMEILSSSFTREKDTAIRGLLLSAMASAGSRDSLVISSALLDPDAQVRRLGVIMGRRWTPNDTSYIVRWQSLRSAGNCDRASEMLSDPSEHVVLLAIDLLGEQQCNVSVIMPLARQNQSWRKKAHATVALARAGAPDARAVLQQLAGSTQWQARAWAAEGAKLIGDSALLQRLSEDEDPNVSAASIVTTQQALRALDRDHAGVLLRAATILLKATTDTAALKADRAARSIRSAFDRISQTKPVTWRDPRMALMKAAANLQPAGKSQATSDWLTKLLHDTDPAIAAAAADLLPRVNNQVAQHTLRYEPPTIPTAEEIAANQDAVATIQFRDVGEVRIRLLNTIAPLTVHTFLTLAERGAYNNRTIHRVVPNFVLQGGSPGADEYDPVTDFFMRDEVGGRNLRGTFGISTRGKDTGDGQFYINLVDNGRLDFDYTVFAETVAGMDVIDRITEGTVIESIRIARPPRIPPGNKRP